MTIEKLAIIGAGLAGLAAARTLVAHGVAVRLFDKGRGAGGRMATRRAEVDGHAFAFDHGAQYLTARGKVFAATLELAGAKAWPQPGRFVGAPRMAQLPRVLADGLDLLPGRHALSVKRRGDCWYLLHAPAATVKPGRPTPTEGLVEDGPFDAIILAMPAPQAAELLQPAAPHLAGLLDKVVMAPCWTLMAALHERPHGLPDWLQLNGGPIAWLARDSSKPGRQDADECWVVQASAAWSRTHLELPAAKVEVLLMDALAKLAGVESWPTPRFAAAHRWRYALVETPLGAPCLWDPAIGIGAAGDWCLGPRAEDAVDSGVAVATAVRRP